jgi:hypothetical protein
MSPGSSWGAPSPCPGSGKLPDSFSQGYSVMATFGGALSPLRFTEHPTRPPDAQREGHTQSECDPRANSRVAGPLGTSSVPEAGDPPG